MNMSALGKWLLVAGLGVSLIGLVVLALSHLPWFGKLPGDIAIKRQNVQFYFPITTCLVLSALISLITYIVRR
jgi:hypothetical protein